MIYRLISKNDWQTARVSGRVDATPSDTDSGFMHFSPKEEVLETALRYFSPELCPVVLEVDEVALGPKLQFEAVATRNHINFPHLYKNSFAIQTVNAVIHLDWCPKAKWSWGRREIFP